MTPLRIGLIAPAWVPVPPPVYGGTEAFLDQLAVGLRRAGHDVVLFTVGESTCPVPMRSHYATAQGISGDMVTELAHVQAAYDALSDVDIVHDNTLLGTLWATAAGVPGPIVTTSHGPFVPELARFFTAVGQRVGVIAISHAQRLTAQQVPCIGVIHHGVDVDAFPRGRGDGDYVLFLGRMSADKGPHRAITAARAAGRRILLAAKMRSPEEREFFSTTVEPLLGPDAVYVGEVGGSRKVDLLAGAEALLNPIRWSEPFGLVMIESLACGTPVLAFPEGSASEIVQHGLTGFLCQDEHDMAAKLSHVGAIEREACRRDVASRFSTDRMVANHVALYRRVLELGVPALVTAAHLTDDLEVLDGGAPRRWGVGTGGAGEVSGPRGRA